MDNDLVGGIPSPLKNMSSSVGVIMTNIWGKKCSKLPISRIFGYGMGACLEARVQGLQ